LQTKVSPGGTAQEPTGAPAPLWRNSARTRSIGSTSGGDHLGPGLVGVLVAGLVAVAADDRGDGVVGAELALVGEVDRGRDRGAGGVRRVASTGSAGDWVGFAACRDRSATGQAWPTLAGRSNPCSTPPIAKQSAPPKVPQLATSTLATLLSARSLIACNTEPYPPEEHVAGKVDRGAGHRLAGTDLGDPGAAASVDVRLLQAD